MNRDFFPFNPDHIRGMVSRWREIPDEQSEAADALDLEAMLVYDEIYPIETRSVQDIALIDSYVAGAVEARKQEFSDLYYNSVTEIYF